MSLFKKRRDPMEQMEKELRQETRGWSMRFMRWSGTFRRMWTRS